MLDFRNALGIPGNEDALITKRENVPVAATFVVEERAGLWTAFQVVHWNSVNANPVDILCFTVLHDRRPNLLGHDGGRYDFGARFLHCVDCFRVEVIAVNIGNKDPVGFGIFCQIRLRWIDMNHFPAVLEHQRAMRDRCDFQITFRSLLRGGLRHEKEKGNKNGGEIHNGLLAS